MTLKEGHDRAGKAPLADAPAGLYTETAALATGACTIICGFEVLDATVIPTITMWACHTNTILFSSFAPASLSRLASTRAALNQRPLSSASCKFSCSSSTQHSNKMRPEIAKSCC